MSPEAKKDLVSQALAELENQIDAFRTDESSLEGDDVKVKVKVVIER